MVWFSKFLTGIKSKFPQKNDAARLTINEDFLVRAILNEITQVIWVDTLDKTQNILNLGNYENLYDRPRQNLQTNPLDWLNALHPEDRLAVEASLHLQRSGDFDVLYRVIQKNGGIKWVRDRSFLIKDDNGAPLYLAGIVSDVSAQIDLEEQLRQDHKMKAIGELAGGICHDFNNVLAVVQGNVELALSAKISPEAETRLTKAFKACERGASLTHRLLAYSRKQPLSPTPIEPSGLINDLNHLLTGSLSEAIELEVVSGAGLWKCHADKAELETVLLNLAINAQHAMGLNGKLTLEVYNARIDENYAKAHREVKPGQYICFAVTDDGAGMTSETQKKAFDPFFTTKNVGEGSGLGLSMAFGFAKQSNGHLKIYSEINRGTTVKLYLPRSMDKSSAVISEPKNLAVEKLSNLSVLVVENDDAVRGTVTEQLKSVGCDVLSARTATEAFSIVEANPLIDLCLFDVVLEGEITGPQLAGMLSGQLPNVSIAFMSGFTENAVIHDGRLDAGVVLVQKPFTRQQLLSACLRALQKDA